MIYFPNWSDMIQKILSAVVKADDLKQQLLADQLKKLPEALCTNDQLLKNSCFLFLRGVSLAVSISLSTIDSTRLYLLITFFMNPVNTQTMRLCLCFNKGVN